MKRYPICRYRNTIAQNQLITHNKQDYIDIFYRYSLSATERASPMRHWVLPSLPHCLASEWYTHPNPDWACIEQRCFWVHRNVWYLYKIRRSKSAKRTESFRKRFGSRGIHHWYCKLRFFSYFKQPWVKGLIAAYFHFRFKTRIIIN